MQSITSYSHLHARKEIMSSTCDLDRKSDSRQNSKTPSPIHNIPYKNDSVCIVLSLIVINNDKL